MVARRGALSPQERRLLYESGFTKWEVQRFNQAKTPDGQIQDLNFGAAAFQGMMTSRRRWVERLRKDGWTPTQVRRQIQRYYTGKTKAKIFDWLKAEYKPPVKVTASQFSAMVKSKDRITRRMSTPTGKKYFRR